MTTRRRPTRAAQARAAAAAAQSTEPSAPAADTAETTVAPAESGDTVTAVRTRSTQGRGRTPRQRATEAAAETASIEATVEAPVEAPVQPVREGREPREGRERHERHERQPREGGERHERQPREGGERHERQPREGGERHERQPREGGDRQQRDGRDRNQQQFQQREGRHRDQRDQRDQRQQGNRDQRGNRDQQRDNRRGPVSFREDNRGNRATEREIREMREAREYAEAMMAERGETAGPMPEVELTELNGMDIGQLFDLAREFNIFNYRRLRRQELIYRIMQTQTDKTGALTAKGVLEILPEGYGFLRVSDYLPSPDDIYVSQTQIRRLDLWSGDVVVGQIRAPKEGEKYFSLVKVEQVNEQPGDAVYHRIPFENLTPIYPCERLKLETNASNLSMRLMDLFNPLGKGQRALIVSPPKAGKTTLLKQVANSISENHPEVHLIALLVDERPEEVTDMQRSINGEVVASTFDELPENHIRVAELVMEKAKRQVEHGKDVVILLDSITRLARAYNSAMPPSGRTLSGGLDPNAMHKPKRFFGAARKLEKSGSLTIIATALIDTGSRMDEVIYEEFKGTGNSELTLDRRLADRRIFPAIDIKRSSTRKEELLLTPEELRKQRILRKTMDAGDTAEVTEFLADRLSRTKSNAEFLMAISDS